MDNVRIGIAGIGYWALDVHIPNLKLVEGAKIAGICSRSEENRKKGIELAGGTAHGFASYEEMIGSDEIDAVIITVPNNLHADYTIKALKAGKHVYCEKPASLTISEVGQIAQLVEETGKVYVVGFELRYSDVAQKVRKMIEDGMIGRLRVVRASSFRPWLFRSGWRSEKEVSGGIFPELTSHYSDIVCFIAGNEPQNLCAMTTEETDPAVAQESIVLFQFPDRVIGSVQVILGVPGGKKQSLPLDVIGSEGRIQADIVSGKIDYWKLGSEEPEDYSVTRSDEKIYGYPGSKEILQAFVNAIMKGEKLICGVDVALLSVKVAQKSIESAQVNEEIKL